MEEKKVLRSTVKWFDKDKGFGFILGADGEKDIFVHYTNIVGKGFRCLVDGQRVEFEVEESEKGRSAVNVRLV